MVISRVPAAPFGRLVRRYVTAQDDPDIAPLALSERSGVHYDTVNALLNFKQQSVSFDIADRLMCAMNMVMLWHTDPDLNEIYLGVDLSVDGLAPSLGKRVRRCAAPGCHNTFELTEPTEAGAKTGRGHSRKIYCSRSCQAKARHIRGGRRRSPSDSRDFVCRNGHERTPENTEHLSNGTRRCRICQRERTQEFRQRQRALRMAA